MVTLSVRRRSPQAPLHHVTPSSSPAADDVGLRLGHATGIQGFLQFRFAQQFLFHGNLADGLAGLETLLGQFRRLVVADQRGQAGAPGQALLDQGFEQRSRSAWMPEAQRSAKTRAARLNNSIDSNRLKAITGIMVFSSNVLPMAAAQVMVASLPTTWAAHCNTISLITGLIFPGMIDEPGWVAGMESSPMPQRAGRWPTSGCRWQSWSNSRRWF